MIPIPVNVIESDAIIWRQIEATNTIVAKLEPTRMTFMLNYVLDVDRTEFVDDYFRCRKYNGKLEYVIKRLNLFVDMYCFVA